MLPPRTLLSPISLYGPLLTSRRIETMQARGPEFESADGFLSVRLGPGNSPPLPHNGEWVMGEAEFTRRLTDGTARYAR